jgi:hypothetical protein
VNAIISLPTETFSKWEKLLNCEITNWSKYFIILKKYHTVCRTENRTGKTNMLNTGLGTGTSMN